jgi:hypothetical protein
MRIGEIYKFVKDIGYEGAKISIFLQIIFLKKKKDITISLVKTYLIAPVEVIFQSLTEF